MSTSVDLTVARLATRQWGVVTRAELLACGLTRKEVEGRIARGQLHPLHRGVYAVGHRRVALEGLFLAAVKACGGAALSHCSAAALRGYIRWDGRAIEVTAPSAHRRPGIVVHRGLPERTVLHGIPVTSRVQTVIDVAQTADEATAKRVLRAAKLSAAELRRLPRSVLDLGVDATASHLEDRVRDFVVGSGLERPLCNPPYRLPGRTVYPDLYWPHLRLIVEVDSREWHDDPLARREDAERQAALEAAGERVLRVTNADLRHPTRLLARLRAAGVRDT